MHRAPNNMDKFMANITEDEQKAKVSQFSNFRRSWKFTKFF